MEETKTIETLQDVWQKRGVKLGHESAILTAEIAKTLFDLTPVQHEQLKKLSDKNIREKMVTPLELIFMTLAEETVKMNVIKDNAVGFEENLIAVQFVA